jgi:hypothetical protein
MSLAREMEDVLREDGSLPASANSAGEAAERLGNELNLEPERMLKLTDVYGPLDWRLAQSHAIYWLTKGLEVGGKQIAINHERLILHAVISLCETGRIVRTNTGFILAEPDFRFLDIADRIYSELNEKYGENTGLASAHENFLQSAVVLLYTYGRSKESLKIYRRLRKLNLSRYRMSLEDYIFLRIRENLDGASALEMSAFIQGILKQSLFSLAIGDDEKSAGLDSLAKLIWSRYMEEYGGTERMSLPPFEVIRNSVVKRVLKGELPESLRDRLKERLGISNDEK